MNVKSFIGSTVTGFVVYYLLGWLFYGIIFTDVHPSSENTNMALIGLGCLFYAMLVSYVWCHWAGFKDWMSGLKGGAIFGLISTLSSVCFMFSNMPMDTTIFMKEIFIMTVSTAIMGAAIAFVNAKLSE